MSNAESASETGNIISICYKPKAVRSPDAYLRVVRDGVELVAGRGIRGDSKGRSPRRQLNIMSQETVEQLRAEGYRTAPGELGEQIVISGIDVQTLPPGTRLLMGDSAVIEIFSVREPCNRFEHIQGKPQAYERVGVLAGVITGGQIGIGDVVRVIAADKIIQPDESTLPDTAGISS